ncbi:MAG: ATP-binding protein, partial [Granulosicoccus sp.]
APSSVAQLLQQGLFPPIHDRPVAAEVWLQDYIATYVERDVRALMNIRDVVAFQRFVQLCAGRCGQLLNINSLAEDAGINRATAQSWLSVLQASHLVLLVQPWATNISKRLIKTPKLYFVDSALAASLMGIRDVSQVMAHPLRGALFENWAIMELIKGQCNAGLKPSVYFLRDKQGHELDALIETGSGSLMGIEIKSGATVASDFFNGLDHWRERLGSVTLDPWLIYGGNSRQRRERGHVVPWNDMDALLNEMVSTR